MLTTLPMPSWFVYRVNGIGSAQNQPWLEPRKSFFHPITDDEPHNMLTHAHEDDEESSHAS